MARTTPPSRGYRWKHFIESKKKKHTRRKTSKDDKRQRLMIDTMFALFANVISRYIWEGLQTYIYQHSIEKRVSHLLKTGQVITFSLPRLRSEGFRVRYGGPLWFAIGSVLDVASLHVMSSCRVTSHVPWRQVLSRRLAWHRFVSCQELFSCPVMSGPVLSC